MRRTLVLLLTVVAVACTSQPPSTAAPSPDTSTAAYPTDSVYGHLFARVGADGSVDKQLAIDAFSTAIAPLPGADPVSGGVPQDWERMDGTFAVSWISRYHDQLNAAQQAAVDKALAIPPNVTLELPDGTEQPGSPESAEIRTAAFVSDDQQTYIDKLKTASASIAGHMHRPLSLPWTLTVNTEQLEGSDALAYAQYDSPASGGSSCGIHLNPSLFTDAPDSVDATLAHEMFHCFQFSLVGRTGFTQLPPWVVEGEAEWAGDNVFRPSLVGHQWWDEYLDTPHTALSGRTYDAAGFFWHMKEVGIDPWTKLDPVLTGATDSARFQAAVGGQDVFLDTWASGLARDASIAGGGGAWWTNAAWPDGNRAQPVGTTVTAGSTLELKAQPLTNYVYQVTAWPDIVEANFLGRSRIHLSLAGGDLVDMNNVFLCFKSDGCACPPGEYFEGPPLVDAISPFLVAQTGALEGATGELTGHDLSEYCKNAAQESGKPPSKMYLPCGDNPCGSLGGDPHMRTYDTYRYDLQAAGEFVLTRSLDDSFEIQARMQPVGTSSSGSASTAVAAKIGDSHVMLSLADGALGSGTQLKVAIDGTPLAGESQSVGGGSVQATSAADQVALHWPDGSVALATIISGAGIDVEVKPAASLRGHLAGLLGDFDGTTSNDFRLTDGTVLGPPLSFSDLYGQFANAWRVTDSTSLFTYEPGTSTETFTDESFPREDPNAAVAADIDSARAMCISSGLDPNDEAALADCAFDYAATGLPVFVQSAVEQSTAPPANAIDVGGGSGGGQTATPTPIGSTVDHGTVSLNQTATAQFGAPNERDVFELHADAGNIGSFTTTADCSSLTAGGTPTWYLARASNLDVPISAPVPFCIDIGPFTFTTSDDYAVVLLANGYTVPFAFTWTAYTSATSSPATIALGGDVSGSIDQPDEKDVYLLTTAGDTTVTITSPNGCDDGFVWKITQGDTDSSPGIGTLCGTQPPVHLGAADTYRITISAPDGVTGPYSFRVDATP